MSSPVTTTYSLGPDDSLRRKQEERERIKKEREERFLQQMHELELAELRWRAQDLHKTGQAVQEEIRRIQTASLGRLQVSLTLSAPPSDLEGLRQYLKDSLVKIENARKQIDASHAGIRTQDVAESLISPHMKGSLRQSSDVLPPAPNRPAPPQPQESSIVAIRNGVAENVRKFLERYKTVLPDKLLPVIRQIYEIQDQLEATKLAAQIRMGLSDEQSCIDAERKEARKLRESLANLSQQGDPLIREIMSNLEGVEKGEYRLSDDLKRSVETVRNEMEVRRRRLDADASDIVKHALEDLGYEVDTFTDTLFTQGGTVHIHKTEWGADHMVRMRVDSKNKTLNFNVVRLVESPSSQPSDVQKKVDTAVENSWCSGFDKFIATLKDRGLDLGITRRFDPGTLHVQQVETGSVSPEFLKRIRPETEAGDAATGESIRHREASR